MTPIVLFTYNRPEHTRRTVEALQKNELASDSELYIYSDGPKDADAVDKVKGVREYLNTIQGFKKLNIIHRDKNYGLSESVIHGVTEVVTAFEKVIVLEDDMVTSPFFLRYINEALTLYADEPRVASIHGYIYPINDLPDTFFIKGADCWGWGTWKRAWDHFEADGRVLLQQLEDHRLQKTANFNNSFNYTQMLKDQIAGNNDSWAVRWYFSAFLNDLLTLYPGRSFVQNIGHGAGASHCQAENDTYNVQLADEYSLGVQEVTEHLIARRKMEEFFRSMGTGLVDKARNKVGRLWNETFS